MIKKFYLIFILLIVAQQIVVQAQTTSTYAELKNTIEKQRLVYYEKYKQTDSLQRDSLLNVAHQYVFTTLVNDIFPSWYGTPWAFHGHTKTPKQGSIACGYFVTTTLQDVGFKLPRIKWAQMESERIIRKLTTDVKRFHNAPITDVVKYINNKGDGLYIVGLDQHVGFIVKQGNTLKFIHSNYYKPKEGVMAEPLVGWNPLNYSKYRVVGKIFDTDMIERWVTGYNYE